MATKRSMFIQHTSHPLEQGLLVRRSAIQQVPMQLFDESIPNVCSHSRILHSQMRQKC